MELNEKIRKIVDDFGNDIITFEEAYSRSKKALIENGITDENKISLVINTIINDAMTTKMKNYLKKLVGNDNKLKYGTSVDYMSDEAIEFIYNEEIKKTKNKETPKNNDKLSNESSRIESVQNVFPDASLSEGEKEAAKKAAPVYDKIIKNVSTPEESNVKKVDVSPERKEKLKNSKKKLNIKKTLLYTGIAVCFLSNPFMEVALAGLECALFGSLIMKSKPKNAPFIALKEKVTNLWSILSKEPFMKEVEEGRSK